MDTQQLQKDKLNIISWISQLQDDVLVEKIKSLMSSSDSGFTLTEGQQKILDSQLNSDKSSYTDAETHYLDLKSKYEL